MTTEKRLEKCQKLFDKGLDKKNMQKVLRLLEAPHYTAKEVESFRLWNDYLPLADEFLPVLRMILLPEMRNRIAEHDKIQFSAARPHGVSRLLHPAQPPVLTEEPVRPAVARRVNPALRNRLRWTFVHPPHPAGRVEVPEVVRFPVALDHRIDERQDRRAPDLVAIDARMQEVRHDLR